MAMIAMTTNSSIKVKALVLSLWVCFIASFFVNPVVGLAMFIEPRRIVSNRFLISFSNSGASAEPPEKVRGFLQETGGCVKNSRILRESDALSGEKTRASCTQITATEARVLAAGWTPVGFQTSRA
jgi:hypothetical protein